jgi:hypothetical protein
MMVGVQVYIEGYLQAMLDALFKQDYLRVKVSDDQVSVNLLFKNVLKCLCRYNSFDNFSE